jgi:hypothetical protein
MEPPTNIVDGKALIAIGIPGFLTEPIQIQDLSSERYQYSISDKIIESTANSTTSELATAIYEAENPNNKECNSQSCQFGIGTMQIVQSTFDEQCEGDVYNEDDNIRCALKLIEKEELWRWKQSAWNLKDHQGWLDKLSTSTKEYALDILNERELATCSCVGYMRELGHEFPRILDPSYLQPNASPQIGNMILLNYNLPHIGEVFDLRAGVLFYKERVLISGKCYTRINWIEYSDPRIRGFRT